MLPELQATKRLLEPELIKLGKALGISLRIGRGYYTHDTFTIKIEGGRIVKGQVMDRDAEYLKENCHWLGINYGQVVLIRNQSYTIIGYNRKGRVRPVVLRDAYGKKVVAPLQLVKEAA